MKNRNYTIKTIDVPFIKRYARCYESLKFLDTKPSEVYPKEVEIRINNLCNLD